MKRIIVPVLLISIASATELRCFNDGFDDKKNYPREETVRPPPRGKRLVKEPLEPRDKGHREFDRPEVIVPSDIQKPPRAKL